MLSMLSMLFMLSMITLTRCCMFICMFTTLHRAVCIGRGSGRAFQIAHRTIWNYSVFNNFEEVYERKPDNERVSYTT